MNASSLLLLTDPQITKVLVGQSEDEFSVHTRLICHYCHYFRSQYAIDTAEAGENTFRLPRLANAAFRSLQAWLYESAVHPNSHHGPELKLHEVATLDGHERATINKWSMLIDLYILAYDLDVLSLRNQVITRIQAEYDGQWEMGDGQPLPSHADVCKAWNDLPLASHLCRWLTTAFAHRWRSWEENAAEISKLPEAFRNSVMNLNNRRIHERRQDEEPHFASDLCIYHDHESRKERRKCQRVGGGTQGEHRMKRTYAQQATPNSEQHADDSGRDDSAEPGEAQDNVRGSVEPWIIKIEPEEDHEVGGQEDDSEIVLGQSEDGAHWPNMDDREPADDNVRGGSSTARLERVSKQPIGQVIRGGHANVRAPTLDLRDHAEGDDVIKHETVRGSSDESTPEAELEAEGSTFLDHALDEVMSELEGSDSGIGWAEQAFIPDEEMKLARDDHVDSAEEVSNPINEDPSAMEYPNAGANSQSAESDEGHESEADEYQPTTVLGPGRRGRTYGSYKARERRPRMVLKFWSKTKAEWERADRGQRMKWTHVGNIMELPELRERRSTACRRCRGSRYEEDCFVYTREALQLFSGSASIKYGKCAPCHFNGRRCE